MSYDFKPEDHTAAEVVEHLEDAPQEEVAQVVQAEEAGKARKTVLESEPAAALVPDQFTEEQLTREEPDGRVKYAWEV